MLRSVTGPSSTPPPVERTLRWLACAGLSLAVLMAYANSFTGPFIFDDLPAITENDSIRRIGDLRRIVAPQDDGGVTVGGRPLLNLSFAFNFAMGGTAVAGYHIVNVAIHLSAACVLFGVLWRTFQRPALARHFGLAAHPLALAIAGCWALHPLQTSAVTYVVQRAESLMGLCYLVTLYGFVRSTSAPAGANRWLILSLIACLAGMASKEVMVSAPLIVLLYDRTFVAGSFVGALKRRPIYYLSLAATWLLLAALVVSTDGRGGTAGFDTKVSSWSYLLTQCDAIMRYLGLAAWPHPLVFDYGTTTVGGPADVWIQALVLAALLVGTTYALCFHPIIGFVGGWFWLILAPTSSFLPVASQTVAEHRMYLPLAAVITLGTVGLYRRLGKWTWWLSGAAALTGGMLTADRNTDYRSDLTLWADTAAKRPENARAHNNLAKAVFAAGRPAEAITHYTMAIARDPAAPEPHNNLGLALAQLNRRAEAAAAYREALRLRSTYPEAHQNLATTLLARGEITAAIEHYQHAITLRPTFALAHSNLANALLEAGRIADAIRSGLHAVKLDPLSANAHYHLGNAQVQAGQLPAALTSFATAVQLKADYASAHNNLANVLAELDRLPEAIVHYEAALRLEPDFFQPRRNLALLLLHLQRPREALPHLETLVRLRPDDAEVRSALTTIRSSSPR